MKRIVIGLGLVSVLYSSQVCAKDVKSVVLQNSKIIKKLVIQNNLLNEKINLLHYQLDKLNALVHNGIETTFSKETKISLVNDFSLTNKSKFHVLKKDNSKFYKIKTYFANVRKNHSIHSEIVKVFKRGTVVEITEKYGKWYKIKENLWIFSGVLEKEIKKGI